jgi:hypothetical protein
MLLVETSPYNNSQESESEPQQSVEITPIRLHNLDEVYRITSGVIENLQDSNQLPQFSAYTPPEHSLSQSWHWQGSILSAAESSVDLCTSLDIEDEYAFKTKVTSTVKERVLDDPPEWEHPPYLERSWNMNELNINREYKREFDMALSDALKIAMFDLDDADIIMEQDRKNKAKRSSHK